MRGTCIMCDAVLFNEVRLWGDAELCNECYQELEDVRSEEVIEDGDMEKEEESTRCED